MALRPRAAICDGDRGGWTRTADPRLTLRAMSEHAFLAFSFSWISVFYKINTNLGEGCSSFSENSHLTESNADASVMHRLASTANCKENVGLAYRWHLGESGGSFFKLNKPGQLDRSCQS